MRKNSLLLLSVIVLLLAGITAFSHAAWIHAKAELAQVLLDAAWQESFRSGKVVRPWAWADTWPVARLSVPSQDVDMIILDGSNGASLPFAPGHLAGTAMPGEKGISVIAAHRDTHFTFLENLQAGERVFVVRQDGRQVSYRVSSMKIINTRDGLPRLHSDNSQLVMVTCYPFDTISAGTPFRYVVTAEAVTTPSLTRM